ncbi:hypothetical protein LWI29_028434 [Acer saccharum]|uniref:Zinc finger PHD-type domain-containing protein n=1 Tax=Acer saccharum TaxID=4024 RepID=A0AA39W5I4_ACESA|nr:hypothetical protein LWI29_028434 [Acer saccharum]
MASSDDEVDFGPKSVSNYYFEDETDQPVSFAVLPIQWCENESPVGNKRRISLRGTADKGLQTIHKHVTAWKFDLTNVIPEILVLSKEKNWIKLLKPRKSFEETIRTVLITVHCISYAKRNPEASGKSLWDHLSRTFSLYEVRPSQNDLVDHIDLISEALKRDDSLAKSKFLVMFLEEKPRKKKISDQDGQTMTMSGFIVGDTDDVMHDVANEDESEEENDLFDSVCAFCDNGGDLLCCEGRCLRSFHPTVEAGEDNACETLDLTEEEVDAIQDFLCKNCEYKQHQCSACGKLGSSDKDKGAEVFLCASATCGHFYHPLCVSKLLFRDDEAAVENLQKSIAQGGSFTCPLHKCHVCKGGENKMDSEMQFAVCRRCPKAYHRKCLPRKIAFEDEEKEGLITRAWEGLLPNNRILIYCLKHDIIGKLGTPSRDHIKFPHTEEEKTVVEGSKKKQKPGLSSNRETVVSMKSGRFIKDSFLGKSAAKSVTRSPSAMKRSETMPKSERVSAVSDSSRKVKTADASKSSQKKYMKSASMGVNRSSTSDASKNNLGARLFAFMTQGDEQTEPGKRDTPNSELTKTVTVTPARKKLNTELPPLDADAERSLLSLMEDAASSITLEDIQKKHRMPSTHAYSLKNYVDRTIKLGRVEGSVEAVQTALKKLEEENSSIEDAKAVCQPEVLDQIFRWKNKLKVYLAPFLHGMRYTSFGRHFTKVEKLQDIADRLHWYVQGGDMIVDFCCGANDFSCLMKKKLEATGKKCLYKNYDIFPAKNDFNFEKRDWFTVKPGELAPGSQLIMGLNPPFGVKAALANMFINKALEFNPKLLILIVPPETERLDKKKPPYDLVWEDEQFLSGKSFYLPGSVDENDKQMDQWNLVSPPLYLWSRRDWTAKHKAIAEKNGHIISREHEGSNLVKNSKETDIIDQVMEDDFGGDTSMLTDLTLQNNEVEKLRQKATEGRKGSSSDSGSNRGLKDSHDYRRSQSSKDKRKREHRNKNSGSEMSGKSAADEQSGGRHTGSEIHNGIPHRSQANVIDGRSSAEGRPSKSVEVPSRTGFVDNNYQHLEPSMSHSHMQSGTACGENQSSIPGEMGGKSGISGKSPVDKQSGGRHPGSEIYVGNPGRSSPANVIESRSSAEVHPSRSIERPSQSIERPSQRFEPSMAGSLRTAKVIESRSSAEVHPSRSIERPSQHFEPSMASSLRTAYGGTQASISDEMDWRYGMNNSDPYSNYRFSSGVNLGEQFTAGRVRENADYLNHRPYMSNIERESDLRSQFGYYGQDPTGSDPIFGQLGSLPSAATYGHLGSANSTAFRMNSSVMQRYAPQLNDLNPAMTPNFRFEPSLPPPPPLPMGDGFYDRRAPMTGHQPDPFANPPSPHYPYPHPGPGSGGWLND